MNPPSVRWRRGNDGPSKLTSAAEVPRAEWHCIRGVQFIPSVGDRLIGRRTHLRPRGGNAMRRVASNRKVLFSLMALSVSVFLLLAGSPLFSAADSAARRPLSRLGLVIPTSPGFDSLQAGYPSVLL